MKMRWLLVALMLGLLIASPTRAQAPILPPGEKEPLVRLEAGGPTSFVTALAFSPDGKLLYSGGWDKVVRVWSLNEQGQFVPFPATYRVPIGPGLSGAINCIALSPDGLLLAVAGRGVFRQGAGFRQPGWVLPSLGAMNADMLRDQGMIYVFDTRTQAVRLLRGHLGTVLSMTFAQAEGGAPPVLVSAAREWNADTNKYQGVIRAWNAATGEELAGISEQPATDVRPGLAAWRTGRGIKDIHVGIAWGDGILKVWNVAQQNTWSERDNKENTALARLPDLGKLISTSLDFEKNKKLDGVARVWSFSPDSGLKLDGPKATLPFEGESTIIPRAIALAPSRPAGLVNHVVLAYGVYPPEKKQFEYRLRLLDVATLRRIDGLDDVPLWLSADIPALAASSQGYLAVAGNSDHNIHIYSVQNLLQNQTKPQILHSVGATFRYVSFVTKGKELGILLSETAAQKLGPAPRNPEQGDLIFDFTKRPLTGDIREWQTAAPPADGWQARLSKVDDQAVLAVFRGQELFREIKLPKSQNLAVTDYALLAPRPPLNVPILAVAYHDLGQPWLVLYDGKTGEQIRQFTGHVDPISRLAFSPDGRLLASVAEDQTVCVWSLTNLDKILGQLGMLLGVAVKDQNGTVAVGKVSDDSPSRGKLAVGEIIEGLVEKEKLRELKTPRDFYFALAKMPPRSPVTLRVRGRAGHRDVPLVVGQGVDERKPLFSLFVTKPDREWIGWNPIGRFESSGPKPETYIGWHFNTGEADGPTRFALAEEYAKKYYQEGVLKDLIRVDQGEIKKLPPPPPPPPPKIGLLIDEDGAEPGQFPEPNAQGHLQLRHARAKLHISITGRPVDTLHSVTWKMDLGAEKSIDLAQVAGQEIEVPLEFARGNHQIRVTVKTPEGPTEYSEAVTLRYQPPAPLVKYTGERTILVKEPKFDLRALLLAGAANEPVKVTILQKSKDKEILNQTQTYTFASEKSLAVSRPLDLEKGPNMVEITAVNEGASGDGAEAETDRLVLEINYFKDAPPPTIALRGIVPQAEGAPSAEIKINPGHSLRVNVPNIRILGEIRGAEDEDLVDAQWAAGKNGALQKLTTFVAMKKKLPINEKVELRPGTQVFRFLAKTATSSLEERPVTIDYQPLVPQATITSPRNGALLKGEEESTSVELQASFGPTNDQQPFAAIVMVNGRELPEPARIDPESRTITAKVSLNPGVNQLRVKLSNDWASTSASEEVAVRYLRPPAILAVRPEDPKEGVPFASLEARVHSATPIPESSIHVFVNQSERKAKIDFPDKPDEGNIWTLRLTHIPLDANATAPTINKIQVRVGNLEAEAEKEGTAQVVYHPKLPPPVVEFTQPVNSVSVTRPEFKVQFQVQSKTPLEQVKLLHEKHEPVSVDVSQAEARPDGSFLLTAEVPLKLVVGPNTLAIEALNKGGVQSSPPLEINYIYRPVRVAVDDLAPSKPGGKPAKATAQSGGQIAFDPLEEGRLKLHGHVLWDEADDQRLASAKVVRVYVNGFQQLPAPLQKPGDNPRERGFQTNLVLNRDLGNHIELALPDLAKEFNKNRLQFTVDCRKPERSQRLHLLVVTIKDKDPKPLETQIRQAFQSGTNGTSQSTKAFDPIFSYPPLSDYHVQPSYVRFQLVKIKNNIRKLSQIGAASSDVLAVYYRGGEAVNSQGNLFQTYSSRPGADSRESTLTCDEVVSIFEETPGAQILLLDVDRQGVSLAQDRIGAWDQYYPRIGMLHYAWLGQRNAPKNPALLEAIEKAMGEATRLVEVRDGVERIATASTDFQKKVLLYKTYLPKDLEGMNVR